MKGIVVTYIQSRYFGFVRAEDGKEIFFHSSNYTGTPRLGAEVTFEIGDPVRLGKKPQALKLVPTGRSIDVLGGLDVLSSNGGAQ